MNTLFLLRIDGKVKWTKSSFGKLLLKKNEDIIKKYVGNTLNGKPDGLGEAYFFKNKDFLDRRYDDFLCYKGYWKEGKYDGNGITFDNSGQKTYEGEFKNDLHHGQGISYLDGKVWYNGEWKEGRKNGFGKEESFDGTYDGEWVNNEYHGEGKYIFRDGTIYEGEWIDGKQCGKGILTVYDGDRIVGEFKNNKPHGFAKYTYHHGQEYTGEFKDGQYHGKGTLVFEDGKVLEGKFENFQLNGHGTLTWPDGQEYEGEWKDSFKHGQGKQIYPDGSVYEGEFKYGQKHGYGVETFSIGRWLGWKYEGEWKFNQFNGQGKYFWPDGTITEGKFLDGDQRGWNVKIYNNEKKNIGSIIYGVMDGENPKETSEEKKDGILYWRLSKYKKGELAWFEDEEEGDEKYIGEIKNGLPNGKGRIDYKSPDITIYSYEGEFLNGDWHGKGVSRDKGSKKEGKWKEGGLHGFATITHSEDLSKTEGYFRNGKNWNTVCHDQKGKLITRFLGGVKFNANFFNHISYQ